MNRKKIGTVAAKLINSRLERYTCRALRFSDYAESYVRFFKNNDSLHPYDFEESGYITDKVWQKTINHRVMALLFWALCPEELLP